MQQHELYWARLMLSQVLNDSAVPNAQSGSRVDVPSKTYAVAFLFLFYIHASLYIMCPFLSNTHVNTNYSDVNVVCAQPVN